MGNTVKHVFSPSSFFIDNGASSLNPLKGSGYNPGGYLWSAAGKALKPKTPGPTDAEQALQRAQLALIYKQDEDINAKKLRILRGESASFSTLLRAGQTGLGPATAPASGGGTVGRGIQPVRGGRGGSL